MSEKPAPENVEEYLSILRTGLVESNGGDLVASESLFLTKARHYG